MFHFTKLRNVVMLSVVGKKYAGIVVERVSKVTCGLIDDEQDCFRGRRGCVDLDYPKTLR